ncbi:MAG: fluoride efflux transporter CrcB [Spirochaetia bacterium]|jgi:CrcB protein|nr:fluoride efflux transporter CrcB [Spirochaetia bacterium]
MQFLYVLAGGGIGALLRYASSQYITSLLGTAFPFATLCVNAAGALAAGFLFSVFQMLLVPSALRLFLVSGFLGGFTTFSAYSLETANAFLEGNAQRALLNILLNNALCIISVLLGIFAGRLIVKA